MTTALLKLLPTHRDNCFRQPTFYLKEAIETLLDVH